MPNRPLAAVALFASATGQRCHVDLDAAVEPTVILPAVLVDSPDQRLHVALSLDTLDAIVAAVEDAKAERDRTDLAAAQDVCRHCAQDVERVDVPGRPEASCWVHPLTADGRPRATACHPYVDTVATPGG